MPLASRHEVVVMVDTSASQTGPIRVEGLEVVDELLSALPTNASISLVACDVKAVPLTKGLVAVGSPETASRLWPIAAARSTRLDQLGRRSANRVVAVF